MECVLLGPRLNLGYAAKGISNLAYMLNLSWQTFCLTLAVLCSNISGSSNNSYLSDNIMQVSANATGCKCSVRCTPLQWMNHYSRFYSSKTREKTRSADWLSLSDSVKHYSGFTLERHGSSERRRRGVYTSGTAVCATQMGVNFRHFSGTVLLAVDAACTIFPSGTGVVTRAAILFTLVRLPLPKFR